MTEERYQKAMSAGHSAAWDQSWDEAAEAYQEALNAKPDDTKALSSLALAQFQMQSFENSLKTYIRLAKVSPNDPIPFEKIAQLSERTGALKDAVAAAAKAADLYLSQKDVNKAIENWSRVTQLDPENILAHSRLALVHERLGHKQRAVAEYLALASLMQRAGKADKTNEMISRAYKIDSGNQALQQAITLLETGQLLPKPMRPKGGTGPLRMALVKEMNDPKEEVKSSLDPVTEAGKKALTILAEILFEYSDDSGEEKARTGMQAIMHGTAHLSLKKLEQTKVIMHLGQAIDAQSKKQNDTAADELAQALLAGFEHPALCFDLGMLRAEGKRYESALPHLKKAASHVDFGLAARLLSGEALIHLKRPKEAALEYLEALKLADIMVAPKEQADSLRQLYEPLLETQANEEDEKAQTLLCANIGKMLMRKNWRSHLLEARKELPQAEGGALLPLADILIQAQSSEVLGAMARVNELARQGHMRSAMDEAFQALTYAPVYLPLHSLIGELLIKDDRTTDAIAKFNVIAEAYKVRGEQNQAAQYLRRIIQLAPMDLNSRNKLIDGLTARGAINEAIQEYINLADIYYRLAELDMARNTYTTALKSAQQGNADRSWNVYILRRMADIDMQRLDWRKALRVYEQIRTLDPADSNARKSLIDLNLKLVNSSQALGELRGYIEYLDAHPAAENNIIAMLEDLLMSHPSVPELHQTVAEQYLKEGKQDEAVPAYDRAAELYLDSGKKDEASKIIKAILGLNTSNAGEYQQVLSQIQGGD